MRKARHGSVALTVAIAVPFLAGREEVPHGYAVVAVVNGSPITFGQVWARSRKELEAVHTRAGERAFQAFARKTLEETLEDLIDRELILAKAKEEGLSVEEKQIEVYAEREMEYFNSLGENLTSMQDYWERIHQQTGLTEKEHREELRARVIVSHYLRRFVWQPEYFSPEVVRSYYLEHQNEYRSGGVVTLRHIYVRREDRNFKQIVDEVTGWIKERGFEAAAREAVAKGYSQRQGSDGAGCYMFAMGKRGEVPAATGEAYGSILSIETLRDPLPKIVSSLGIGEVSRPIELEQGTHLLAVVDRSGGRVKTFDEVQVDIQRKLIDDLARIATREYVAKLAENAGVNRLRFPEETPLGRIQWDDREEGLEGAEGPGSRVEAGRP